MEKSLPVILSEPKGVLQASKWLHIQILASYEEVKTLFAQFQEIPIFLLGTPLSKEGITVSHADFLSLYGEMVESLQKGSMPDLSVAKKILPCCLGEDLSALYLLKLEGERYLLKLRKPLLQIHAHFFRYSPVDRSFRSMILGGESIFWGLQFSFPQIFQDPDSHEIQKLSPQTGLFALVCKWARDCSQPTPFLLEDNTRINVPIRLGNSCFSWIASHPQLQSQKIQVAGGANAY